MPKGVYIHKTGYTRPPRSEAWLRNMSVARLGKKHKQDCKHCVAVSRMLSSETGEKNRNWKGDDAKYEAIHHWLRTNFKQGSCEHCNRIKNVDWALIRGMKYERKRENFIRLCRKCHIAYDKHIK